jgi:two-component system sensor kinase FixL
LLGRNPNPNSDAIREITALGARVIPLAGDISDEAGMMALLARLGVEALMRNAIEAMEDSKTRELVVSTSPVSDDLVEISVADTGAGISPEIGGQLFQPFVTTKRQGMGVGLSISRTIVEAHGGSLAPRPNPGGGTVFTFTLPAVTREEAGDAV